ncbi:MFS transporter [Paraburkholderia tagetis]|uniref:Aconitase family protein n=1 Tax=Paraburkholderia tagetis TaxID=2913261 RepID=A0A9X1UFQ1_9BURK|nr:MFS transporter [Paraburkholderia tagetis]MCG5072188.1 aconitase family protein [Paraburkholderia tagetis]
MATLDLSGRILFLCTDADKIEQQLAGTDLVDVSADALRDDVSTDEITPMSVLTRFDERLGRVPYLGLRVGDRNPIGMDAVRAGGFCVTVAGNRYGKGSSREHSPLAEYRAGIRLVIAESFERIYRQNADNLGLFTSTDFGLIARIRRGEPIEIDELVASRDSLAAEILRSGGLLRYGARTMRQIRFAAQTPDRVPRTLVQKILERHALQTGGIGETLAPGAGAFVRADWRFIHEYYTGMATHMLHAAFGQPLELHERATIIAFEDHLSYAHKSELHVRNGLLPDVRELSAAHRAFAREYGVKNHGYLSETDAAFSEGSEGISHAMMAERYALPGQLIVGTDSHTPHSGALGCVAFGVGTTDVANALVTGAVRMTVPQSLRVNFNGAIAAERTIMLVVFHIFQTVGFYGFANWVPTLLVKQGITVTSSLLYTTVIGLAAPLGPLLGYWIADRFERKHVIVFMAAVNIVSGLLFSQVASALAIVTLGVLLTLAGNIISFTYHMYQQELYPTTIRARAVGFVYSWSRLSAVFSSFVVAFMLKQFGVTGVFVFIAGAMALVIVAIGVMGPRTLGKSLESISH